MNRVQRVPASSDGQAEALIAVETTLLSHAGDFCYFLTNSVHRTSRTTVSAFVPIEIEDIEKLMANGNSLGQEHKRLVNQTPK
jgi:hypothetical protein